MTTTAASPDTPAVQPPTDGASTQEPATAVESGDGTMGGGTTGGAPKGSGADGEPTEASTGGTAPVSPSRTDLDRSPTPITWLNLPVWALRTLRAERRYYRKLDRAPRLTSKRLAASLLPSIDRPIFVIGAARSGTTFLGDCVGHLPEVSYHHEPPATKAAGRYVYEERWGTGRARWFYRSVYAWLLRVELDGNLRFCEKTPTNALLIPFLDGAFDGAQFIHIVRDGRDAAASHIRKPWLRADAGGSGVREPGGYLHGPYAPWWVEKDRRDEFELTSDAHRMIWSWRRYTEAALRDGGALPADRYLELRYESLVADPKREGERVLDFLGIERPRSRGAFLEAVQRAEEGSSGSWRRTFDADDLAQIETDSGELLRRLGYTDT